MAVITVILAAASASADIYRSDEDSEVVSFTDNPNDRRYQLVMKEQKQRSTKAATPGAPKQPKKDKQAASASLSEEISRSLPIQGRITSPVGYRNDPFDGKLKHHNGLDIAAPTGTPVKPVAPGTVIFSGWKQGYGNTVILEHDDGMTTVYGHHSSNNVGAGTRVDQDTIIAFTGSTGRSTGPHLHFEAWRGGTNISAEFMPGGQSGQDSTGQAANAAVRRYLQPDGTIFFTNLR